MSAKLNEKLRSLAHEHQVALWSKICQATSLQDCERLKDAYDACPRHEFADQVIIEGRSYRKEEFETSPETLSTIYSNKPLLLYENTQSGFWSTISQPSLVFRMLDALALRSGERVFEVGTGSGWNAALMSCLVGETGAVYTAEILEELAGRAARTLLERGHGSVTVIKGSAERGFERAGPFDAVVFTASCPGVPDAIISQLKERGKVLAVVQADDESDELLLGRNEDGQVQFEKLGRCRFIPMRIG